MARGEAAQPTRQAASRAGFEGGMEGSPPHGRNSRPANCRRAAVCEASAAARQSSPTPCGWVCDHSRAPTIFRDANTGAGQDRTDLAAAVQLRLRVALGCKHCSGAAVSSSMQKEEGRMQKQFVQHEAGWSPIRGQRENHFSSPFKNSPDTAAAVCDRRIPAEIYASALTERRYKPLFRRAVRPAMPKVLAKRHSL